MRSNGKRKDKPHKSVGCTGKTGSTHYKLIIYQLQQPMSVIKGKHLPTEIETEGGEKVTKEVFLDDSKKYLYESGLVGNPSRFKVPGVVKLSLLKFTPKEFVKSRVVGKDKAGKNQEAPYIPIRYVERCLNFISNFQRDVKIISKELNEIHYTKDGKSKYVYEAMIEGEVKLSLSHGPTITKQVIGASKSFENPATSKFDAYKIAYANMIKYFAQQIGVGADIAEKYNTSIRNVTKNLIEMERSPEKVEQAADGFDTEN